MKKLVFTFCIIALFQSTTEAQVVKFSQADKIRFETFVEKVPIYEYPVISSRDYKKRTKWNKQKPNLDKDLTENYLCKQLPCVTDNCESKFVFGFMGMSKFILDTFQYQMVLLALDIETGCTEKNYLITYSPQSGEIIDTLVVFSIKTITPPNEKYLWGESIYIESSIVSTTTVEILSIEKLGEIFKKDGKTSRRVRTTKCIYNVSQEGKFEKVEEFLVSDQIE